MRIARRNAPAVLIFVRLVGTNVRSVNLFITTARSLAFICDENASCAPAPSNGKEHAMFKRRPRVKHTVTFHDRLAAFAEEARRQADRLQPGSEKDALLTKARQADAAIHINDWAFSRGLQPPK